MNIKINDKDDIILKILHYFITEENYKPVIINGIENEIWLENMQSDLKLIRINTNYIHNEEQLKVDTFKAQTIMKSIRKNTLSLRMNMLNLLLDTGESVKVFDTKNIETIKVDSINDFKKNKVVNEFFPKVKDSVLNKKADPVEFFKLTEDMNQTTLKNEKKLQKIFSPKKPVITYGIIALNVMIFLCTLVYNPDVIRILFANNYVFTRLNGFYRLLTSAFLHFNIIHLAFNMYALYILGPQVEKYYGKTKFLLIYLISGILGGIFSCVFNSSEVFSYGASGAIFGLFGSILYFTYYYRATLQNLLRSSLIPTLVFNILLGFMIPGIDAFGHIGGLIGDLENLQHVGRIIYYDDKIKELIYQFFLYCSIKPNCFS